MGGTNEFYDKFTVRYHLSVILKHMWENHHHKQTVIEESK